MADNNNPIKYSDLVSPDDSITKLINQLDQLSDAYMNTLKNIKSEAITVKAALEGVSGATENGRKTIRGASNDTDKLTRAARDLAFAESENAKRLAELKQAQKEANELNKLTTRLNQSAEGSYNRLSAQYSINKIYLNNMTVEEREATEEGRKLVAETKAIYEEMKRLQEATGKTSLNVGNYSDAAKGLTKQIENQTKQLALLRLEGKQGTVEYQQLSKETAILRDAVKDATDEITRMASDTSNLDAVLSLAAGASGGFAAYTGAMELFGAESEDVQEAQKKLQAAIAITTGVQAIQNAVQKQSAIMLGISRIQMAALSKAQVYNRLVTMQGTKATLAATIAQKAFNLIAAANPYVLLALALVTVVGALVLFASNTDKSAKNQQKLNEAQKVWLDYLETEATEMNRVSNERVAQLNRELNIAKARNASLSETRKIEDEILSERTKAHNKSVGFYGQELDDLEANRAKLRQLNDMLVQLNNAKARGDKKVYIDVDLDGKIDKVKVDEAIEAVQGQIDNTGRAVDIAVNLKTEGADLDAERKILAAQRLQENRDAAKAETDILRKAEDARIALIKNTFDQQRAQRQAANARAIADIQLQLRTETNLTVKARKALNDQIVLLREQLAVDMIDIANQQRAAELSAQRTTQDAQIALMKEGAEKQREQLRVEYERQIQDINTRLETERGLTETQVAELLNQQLLLQQQYAKSLGELNDQITIDQMQAAADRTQLQLDAAREGSQEEINLRIQLLQQQRAIELAQNRQLAEDVRQSEADINAKYDAEVLKQTTELNQQRALMLFDQQQALEASEFDLIRNSEERKTRFRLEQEKARLQKILELNKAAGVKMTDAELQTVQNTIAKIDQEIEKSKGDERGNDIYGLFGLNLDDDQKEAISTSVEFAIEQLNSFLDAKVQAAEAAVSAADQEVDASQRRLDAELEARANGYANNVAMAQKELDMAKKNQEKALKEQQKAQKAQAAIQTIQQIGNLVTASALIWSQLGFPFAIPAIAVMWGSFAASKIKAAQLAKQSNAGQGTESYGDGTVELLNGGSHQSGDDVDLGTKPDGTRRRAEGGEFFAVINKRNSRKYRRIIPDVINSLNRGTFAKKYLNAYNTDGVNISLQQGSTPDLRDLKDDVREIKEQNRRRRYVDGNGNVVEVYKNLTRKFKS
nr:MAG TPA: tail length tape measure protein [Caudoviricetes sp.]